MMMLNMNDQEYVDIVESSKILGVSRRATYNILRDYINNATEYQGFGTESYITYNGKVKKFWFRKDIVEQKIHRKRVSHYKKTCSLCGKKFDRSSISICPECQELEQEHHPDLYRGYDKVAVKALLMILTSEYWWKKATVLMVLFYIIFGIVFASII